jgi:hypothetical protein
MAEVRQEQQRQVTRLKNMGEKGFADMYEARSSRDASLLYTEAKDFYCEAIALAQRLGLESDVQALSDRLEAIKTAFRSQNS